MAPDDVPDPEPPGGAPARRGRLFATALGLLLGVVLALALVEAGLRFYSWVTPNADVEFMRYARLMKKSADHSATSFRHLPGAQARLMGVDVAIDSRGFRDEAESAEVRIALLGDSITFGWGVRYGERFSEILEDAWSTALGRPVELVNTGHGNYNTAQERALLEEAFARERVAGVVQVWYVNDAEPTPPHRELPWYGRFQTAVFVWAKTDLLKRRAGARGTYVEYYRELYRPDAPAFEEFTAALHGVGEWTRAQEVPWVFVVLPEFHSFDPGPLDEIYRRVTALAAESGAIVVDATAAFHGVDPAAIRVAYNDVHPNAKGHAIIAESIRKSIDPRLFVARDAADPSTEASKP